MNKYEAAQMELHGYTLKEISKDGAVFENPTKSDSERVYINFADCIRNFCDEFGNRSKTCVAARDAFNLTFTFYTVPKTVVCFRNGRRRGLLSDYLAAKRFHAMQKKLCEFGFTTYDMT